jgi:hypothetical protein
MFTRSEDWQAQLWGAVDLARGIPFRYGVHDCATFAALCVDRMCGTTLVAQIANLYTPETVADVIESRGGLLAFATEFLGEPVRWQECTTGDVVLARDPAGQAVLTVHEGHALLCPTEVGLTKLPVGNGSVGWRIG